VMNKTQQRQRRLHSIDRRARKRSGSKCRTGKVRFRDHDEAIQVLWHAKMLRTVEGVTERQERRAYLCNACNGWHLTSQENRALLVDPARVYAAQAA